ncbi:ribonuclease R family protein [Acanthopleuribacter pedis]|uniref:Ribonuclease R n=1 Tax=Acanthopleuribacter pedis TaxID=442870 RepID=A0A8J7QBZ7_9BACT|nr:ribonuclease R family protein [Acanthopleuribacter pedis]MBO1320914.1 VacB/RNase II family 3'-5' exoribonuclease [Acanthopleuribacter pedis]
MKIEFETQILQYLGRQEDPIKLKNILKALGLPPNDRQFIRQILREMMKEGKVVKNGSFYWVPNGKESARAVKREKTRARDETVGRLSIANAGYGFVAVEKGRDWMIQEEDLNGALHGDIVRARKRRGDAYGRVRAEIIGVESYGVSVLVGIYQPIAGKIVFTPFSDYNLDPDRLVGEPEKVTPGLIATFKRDERGLFEFDSVLGSYEDPVVDEAIVLAENEIPGSFDPRVMEQVADFNPAYEFELGDRRDFRDEMVFTVDGATARDFDDALHFKQLGQGDIEVGIHIADVSHFVEEDSPLDLWARARGNSTYLPHKAIPMLPQILSNELCSLKPNVPRYTLSCVVRLDQDGVVKDWELCKGLICSSYRLTYEIVDAVSVQGDANMRAGYEEVVPSLDLAISLSQKMRRERIKRGGFNLDMGEVRMELGKDLLMKRVQEKHQTAANHMIEAFMVLANECVAEEMSGLGITVPYRIHDQPDEERLERLAALLSAHGVDVPHFLADDPARAINTVLAQLKSHENAQVMQTQVLKAMKMAEYNIENRGHFGLASEYYAHFTSPIRRYADLIIHRRLTAVLAGGRERVLPEHFDDEQLEAVCKQISKRERASARAEQTFVQLKMLRYLKEHVGDEMEGVIDDVKSFGLFVRLNDLPVSGLVHVETLPGGEYEFVPEILALVGARNGRQFKAGDPLKVRLLRVDYITRKIDFEPSMSRWEKLEMGPSATRVSNRPRRSAKSAERAPRGSRDGGRGQDGAREEGRGPRKKGPSRKSSPGKLWAKSNKGKKGGRKGGKGKQK